MIGNVSEYVPVLTEIVVPGFITAGIADVVPEANPVVIILTRFVAVVEVPISAGIVGSIFCLACADADTLFNV